MAQTLNVSMAPFTQTGSLVCSQYDVGRMAYIYLYDEGGEFNIATGSTVTIHATKPSGLGFTETCTWSGNMVYVESTAAMTSEAGKFPAEIRVTLNDEIIGSANFLMKVEKSPHPNSIIDGQTIEQAGLVDRVGTLETQVDALEAGTVEIDTTLTQSGKAADAKVVGDRIGDMSELETETKTDLVSAINEAAQSGGSAGLTADIKSALLACFQNVAWVNANGQTYYDALDNALNPPAGLINITAVYTQSGTVYDTDTLDSLKPDLVVTAYYDDSTSAVITSYTLSGTLAVGTSTITASFGGKTATFTVTVTEWSTSPVIAMTDKYKTSEGEIKDKTGACFTVPYYFTLDIDAFKETAYYDETNNYANGTGVLFMFKYCMTNDKSAVSWSGAGKLLINNTNDANAQNLTATRNGTEISAPSATHDADFFTTNDNMFGIIFQFGAADAEYCYAYWTTATSTQMLPVGVSDGDIIFAGSQTPYYNKRNINDE